MKKSIQLLILITVLFLSCSSFGQKQKPPQGGEPHNFNLPQKKDKVFENGFKTTMVQYGVIPKSTVSLVIKTGNVNELSNQIWLSNLTSLMIQQGTTNMNFQSLSEKVAGMGGQLSIGIQPDRMTISGTVLSEFTADFIELLADVVIHPSFPSKELDRLKTDLKRNLSVQQSIPQNIANEQFLKLVYKDSPYANYFPTEQMIDSYTVETVKSFYDKNFGAARTTLFVVGVFDEKEVNKVAEKSFKNWKKGLAPDYPTNSTKTQPGTFIINRDSAPQTSLIIGIPVVGPDHPDYMKLMVTNSLLGGGFISRITRNIREDKGFTYSPYSYIMNQKGGSVWEENADITTEHTIDALFEIKKEINQLSQQVPSEEELEGIQNSEAGYFVLQNSTASGIISILFTMDQYSLPMGYLTGMVANIYSVKPQEVSEMVAKYLAFDKLTIVMVGDQKSIEIQMTEKEMK